MRHSRKSAAEGQFGDRQRISQNAGNSQPATELRRWPEFTLAVLAGIAIGVGSYTFVYAKGYSYLRNDPAACTNCHVMQQYYDGWMKSSHRLAATCNDCHAPHSFVGKYATKASNGFFHSLAFTSGRFPDAIGIKGRNRSVTEGACRSCHADIVLAIDGPHRQQPLECIGCHASAGHM